MFWIELAFKSLLNRRLTVTLTALSIALSVALFLSVEKIRHDVKDNFTNSLSGTDLIVGARSSALNLLLYSVFRIGNASNNVSWESYQALSSDPAVDWSIPISLGDSHKGYRVIGTTSDYFVHYQYGRTQHLSITQGHSFNKLYDVVLGSEVAKVLGYKLGDQIIIAHGTGDVSFAQHDDSPFSVSGILAPTGTPVDQSLHVPLQAIEAIHIGWDSGVKTAAGAAVHYQLGDQALRPKTITAALVGMTSRLKTFNFQRQVNEYTAEPLMAIIPGATLQELWRMLRTFENTLRAISGLIVISGLLGLLTVILASLNERQREIALLRALGAPAKHIFTLLSGEAGLIAVAGVVSGVAIHYGLLVALAPYMLSQFGVLLNISLLAPYQFIWLAVFIISSSILGAIPASRVYRQSLNDGLSQRI